jgi:hypothetical protein
MTFIGDVAFPEPKAGELLQRNEMLGAVTAQIVFGSAPNNGLELTGKIETQNDTSVGK